MPSFLLQYQLMVVGEQLLSLGNEREMGFHMHFTRLFVILEVVHLIFLYLIVLQTYKKSNYTKVTHG